MPRLFTGLKIPGQISNALELLQGGIDGARWIEREDMHITLNFIGDVGRRETYEIARELETTTVNPFDVTLSGIDVFGGGSPHSLYVGVAANDQLNRLKERQDNLLRRMGIRLEKRKFKPHVTIARLRNADFGDITRYLSCHGGYGNYPFRVDGFELFSARGSRGGGPYLVEEQYDFA